MRKTHGMALPEAAGQLGADRHIFSAQTYTHLYENGTDLETIRVLMGHKSLSSTIIYVHLAVNGRGSMRSPLDRMMEETR